MVKMEYIVFDYIKIVYITQGKYMFYSYLYPIVYCLREDLIKLASSCSREQLLSFGTCLGKMTKSGQFRLHITAMDYLSPYAKVFVFVHFIRTDILVFSTKYG